MSPSRHSGEIPTAVASTSPVPTPRRPSRCARWGRFSHEAIAFDEGTGNIYETEDATPGGFYKFVPNQYGNPAAGGSLYALKAKGEDNYNFSGLAIRDSDSSAYVDSLTSQAPPSFESATMRGSDKPHSGSRLTASAYSLRASKRGASGQRVRNRCQTPHSPFACESPRASLRGVRACRRFWRMRRPISHRPCARATSP
ncbi:MAG: DUF839 domain-containing protein [Steroidobacteraceae bacterium]|nr:DUF839 domain-containing protein [Steroidobacteraceae bacterium]